MNLYEKKYKEALGWMQSVYPTMTGAVKEDAEHYFPELKESEDEHSKKWILEYLYDGLRKSDEQFKDQFNAAIAWLEKQDNQDNNEDSDILQRFSFYSYKDEPNILYLSGLYVNEECRNKGIGTKILEIADEVAKSLNCHVIRLKTKKNSNAERLYQAHGYNSLATEERDGIWLEKQGELDDNIITRDDEMLHAISVGLTDVVEDAGWSDFGGIPVEEIQDWLKKQDKQNKIEALRTEYEKGRADAIAEMKPAGWSEEDELNLNQAIYVCHQNGYNGVEKWLKSIKDRIQPKQEWKQENTSDLTDFENAMMHIGESFFGQYAGLDPNDTNAIKEQAKLLLELVPSKEWNEEDERIRQCLIQDQENALDDVRNDKYGHSEIISDLKEMYRERIDWLKSLKPQKQWKPTEEQMDALHDLNLTGNISYAGQGQALIELYEQLKIY